MKNKNIIWLNGRETRFNDFNNIYVPFPRKNILKSSFMYHASHLWNDMPNDFKDISTLPVFKGLLKKYVFTMF